jgi:DNA polymerase-3 subunit epsilon
MKAVIVTFDFESTGFTRNHAVELAAVVHAPNGDKYTWYSKAKPSSPIEDGAAAIHGISNKDVENERPDTEVVAEFWADINGLCVEHDARLILSGHNIVSYDMRVLRNYVDVPPDTLTTDTLRLSRKHYPEAPNHKLTTMHEFLKLPGEFKAHSALDDCYMSWGILQHFMGKLNRTVLELADEGKNPVLLSVMPNGKHKGTPISVLPESYMQYMLGLDDLDPDIGHTFKTEMARRRGR